MSDVFDLETAAEKNIEVVVNGSTEHVNVAQGTTILEFVTERAQDAGIRTFSVYVDGQKLDTSQAGRDVFTAQRVEIVAKDSRG